MSCFSPMAVRLHSLRVPAPCLESIPRSERRDQRQPIATSLEALAIWHSPLDSAKGAHV